MALHILMYHAVVPRLAPGLARVHVTEAQFAEQMAWLARSDCRVLPLAEALAALPRPLAPGPPTVALTFDDGYYSLLQRAAPILAAHGLPATLFLTTGFVGQPSFAQEPAFAASAPPADRPLRWAELRELQVLGWTIEAHGHSHRPLAGRPAPEQAAELRDCRAAIARHLGPAPALFAFPYGSYDRRTLQALVPAGYRAAVAVHTGPATAAHDPRRLPRLEVTAGLDLPAFQRLVLTGHSSGGARRRAWLRDQAYRLPWLKDAWARLRPPRYS